MDLKQRYETLVENALNPVQLIREVSEIQTAAINGIQQERVSPRGDILVVTEIDLNLALKCVNSKLAILKLIKTWIDKDSNIDPEFTVTISDLTTP